MQDANVTKTATDNFGSSHRLGHFNLLTYLLFKLLEVETSAHVTNYSICPQLVRGYSASLQENPLPVLRPLLPLIDVRERMLSQIFSSHLCSRDVCNIFRLLGSFFSVNEITY
jgi:hypothetical protein